MPVPRLPFAAACCLILLLTAACGDTNDDALTVTPRAVATIAASPTRPGQPATPRAGSTASPQPPTSGAGADATPTPGQTPPAGFRFEPAPIDGAELLIEASNPGQYQVHITSGLPSGCHVFDHVAVSRSGAEITIDVLNRVPADPMIACTAIYGTHETTVQLGSNFTSGGAYRVQVGTRTIEFTAQ
jgi:hypothetical protein